MIGAGADPAPVADDRGAVDADAVAELDALADQRRARDLGPVSSGLAERTPSATSGAPGSTSTAPPERVEIALHELGDRADVVPVGVDLVE